MSVVREKRFTQLKIKMGKIPGFNSNTNYLIAQRQISNMILSKESFGSCIYYFCVLRASHLIWNCKRFTPSSKDKTRLH